MLSSVGRLKTRRLKSNFLCEVLSVHYVLLGLYHAKHLILPGYKARWLSWLERRPVTAEARGSSPLRVAADLWELHLLQVV